MAYKFKFGRESLTEGARRIAAEEFAHITDALADPALSPSRKVHEARKATKRVRSLIRLVQPALRGAGNENTELRDAARALSSERDAGAILESLHSLKLTAETSAAVELALAATPSDDTGEALLKAFGKAVRPIAKRTSAWELDEEDFDAFRPGLQRAYKRLRQNFAVATETGEENAIHDWRKSAKRHWHHTMLVSRIYPDVMDAHARMAGRLSQCLGEWRDNGLLLEAASSLGDLDKDSARELARSARRNQKRLLKRAARLSALITAEKPAALAKRWAAYAASNNT